MAKIRYASAPKNIVFNLMNRKTLEKIRNQKTMNVPRWRRFNIAKDRRWNEKFMTSQLLQGLMNGESVREMRNRIFEEIDRKSPHGRTEEQRRDIIHRNLISAQRNARTMTTNAECGGRLDSYQELDNRGIVQKKVWIATPDDRTRESHFAMDGEEVDINEEFSNGCMFPADENCPDESEIWNCRCTMKDHIIGFRRADGTISMINYQKPETLHDRQMREEKERRKADA